MNIVPITDLASMKIIRGYFTVFNENLDRDLRTRRFKLRFRNKSQNKVFVNNGEFKHTNNKVVINLYIFNRQINNYNMTMKNLTILYLRKLNYSAKIFSQRLNLLERKSFEALTDKRFKSLKRKKLFLIKNLNRNIFNVKASSYINLCVNNFFQKLLKKEYDKTLQYFFYKQMVYINKSKFTYFYLQYLKKQLFKLYNKQVEFNFINLRRFYLNSDILLESIIRKISRNRKKVSIFVKKLRDKVLVLRKKPYIHKYIINKKPINKTNVSERNDYLVSTIKDKLKYKDITGFRLQAKGRLTKRYTASRSMLKVTHKGNLLNMDSSLKGLSSVLLKGNLKSNLQYTKLASKSRIGSFGLKG